MLLFQVFIYSLTVYLVPPVFQACAKPWGHTLSLMELSILAGMTSNQACRHNRVGIMSQLEKVRVGSPSFRSGVGCLMKYPVEESSEDVLARQE